MSNELSSMSCSFVSPSPLPSSSANHHLDRCLDLNRGTTSHRIPGEGTQIDRSLSPCFQYLKFPSHLLSEGPKSCIKWCLGKFEALLTSQDGVSQKPIKSYGREQIIQAFQLEQINYLNQLTLYFFNSLFNRSDYINEDADDREIHLMHQLLQDLHPVELNFGNFVFFSVITMNFPFKVIPPLIQIDNINIFAPVLRYVSIYFESYIGKCFWTSIYYFIKQHNFEKIKTLFQWLQEESIFASCINHFLDNMNDSLVTKDSPSFDEIQPSKEMEKSYLTTNIHGHDVLIHTESNLLKRHNSHHHHLDTMNTTDLIIDHPKKSLFMIESLFEMFSSHFSTDLLLELLIYYLEPRLLSLGCHSSAFFILLYKIEHHPLLRLTLRKFTAELNKAIFQYLESCLMKFITGQDMASIKLISYLAQCKELIYLINAEKYKSFSELYLMTIRLVYERKMMMLTDGQSEKTSIYNDLRFDGIPSMSISSEISTCDDDQHWLLDWHQLAKIPICFFSYAQLENLIRRFETNRIQPPSSLLLCNPVNGNGQEKTKYWNMCTIFQSIIFHLESEQSLEIKSRLPLSWLLKLIDRWPVRMTWFACLIIEFCLSHATVINLYIFIFQLIDYLDELIGREKNQYLANDDVLNSINFCHFVDNHNPHNKISSIDSSSIFEPYSEDVNYLEKHFFIGHKIKLIRYLILKILGSNLKSSYQLQNVIIVHFIERICDPDRSPSYQSKSNTHPCFKSANNRLAMTSEPNPMAEINPLHRIRGGLKNKAMPSSTHPTIPNDSSHVNLKKRKMMSTLDGHHPIQDEIQSISYSSLASTLIPNIKHSKDKEPIIENLSQPLLTPKPSSDHHLEDINLRSNDTADDLNHDQMATSYLSSESILASNDSPLSEPRPSSPTPSSPTPSISEPSISLYHHYYHHVEQQFLVLLDLALDIRSTTSHALVTDRFLSLVDFSYFMPSYEQYLAFLPQKSTFDRDMVMEQLFFKRPILFQILVLISKVPPQLVRCIAIIKTLLVITVGNWNSEASSVKSNFAIHLVKKDSQNYQFTMKLVRLLQCVDWLPPVFHNVSDCFQYITPRDIVQIMMCIWQFLAENPPTYNIKDEEIEEEVVVTNKIEGASAKFVRNWPEKIQQDKATAVLRFILREHIVTLSEPMKHLYMRTMSVK